MNAANNLHHLALSETGPSQLTQDLGEQRVFEYWDVLVDNRWLITTMVAAALAVGCAYAILAKPIYQANLLIQVEDATGSPAAMLGSASSLFDVKTPAAAETEILRSRMVVGKAVDNALLYIDARPKYAPLVGAWLSRRATGLSEPGFMGVGDWVSGAEKISVTEFEVPEELEGSQFTLTAKGEKHYSLAHNDLTSEVIGALGTTIKAPIRGGFLTLNVAELQGKPGAGFVLTRNSRTRVVEKLQGELRLAEKGRQSGVIEVMLEGTDRGALGRILNEIGSQYVKQNVERKAEEAQKTLAFLQVQLPQLKQQLNESEEAYNRYRNQKGTVALDEEAKLLLNTTAGLQSKLIDAKQKRLELVSRFTTDHPAVKTLDAQISAWDGEISALNARVKNMPSVQQDAIRLERDVKANNELYQQLRNNALQLQLVREGKIGNVRLIDAAIPPVDPVAPKRGMIIALSLMAGLLGGVVLAIGRSFFLRGVRNAHEIEQSTGLSVYSTIPLSGAQARLARKILSKESGVHLLADAAPDDSAIESLRSLRTALQFASLQATDNRIIISGATPGVGKSFVSANFAAVLAAAGKRVLLIDADLRRGHLHQYFGVPRSGGLSELIAGSVSLEQAVRRQQGRGVDFISTGALPPNPAELLMSDSFGALLQRLSPDYDVVLIDTAPVLVAADTLSVATHASTILLVARAGKTQMGELHESVRRLTRMGREVTGVLLNALDLTRRHYGSYSYVHGAYRYQVYRY
jgi:tyrosine-protein kinase Etk/Wzc